MGMFFAALKAPTGVGVLSQVLVPDGGGKGMAARLAEADEPIRPGVTFIEASEMLVGPGVVGERPRQHVEVAQFFQDGPRLIEELDGPGKLGGVVPVTCELRPGGGEFQSLCFRIE